MDDVWLCVEEDNSSSHSAAYSDNVDSDIEAELYGMIHHQENLSDINKSNEENSVNIQTPETANQIKNMSFNDTVEIQTTFIGSYKSFSSTVSPNPKEILFNLDQNNSQQNVYKFSTPLKRKSDSEHNSPSIILCSEDSEAKDSSHLSKCATNLSNKRKKVCISFSKKNNFRKQKKSAVAISSDSDDSVLWTEPDTSVKSDLKTNVLNDADTISISSNSSDDSLIVLPPFGRNEKNLKNLSLPNIKFGENSKDLWHINDDDLYRSKKKSRRYHETIETQCSNCGKKGHSGKSCPVPRSIKCFYCGGAHVGAQCRNKICSKCYTMGHDYKYCWLHYASYCLHCNMKGHAKKDCPDIWRRYHLTTEPTKLVPGKPVNQDRTMYCFNCGWSGHFGAECREPKLTKGSFPTWPSVISYSNPDELLSKRLDSQKNRNRNFRKDCRETQSLLPNTVHDFVAERRAGNQSQQFNTFQDFTSEGKRDNHDFIAERKGENKDSTAERKNAKKDFKKVKKWEFFKQREIERKAARREKDFPRTPKKSEINREATDEMPESVNLILKQQLKQKKKNNKRKWKKFKEQKKIQGENS